MCANKKLQIQTKISDPNSKKSQGMAVFAATIQIRVGHKKHSHEPRSEWIRSWRRRPTRRWSAAGRSAGRGAAAAAQGSEEQALLLTLTARHTAQGMLKVVGSMCCPVFLPRIRRQTLRRRSARLCRGRSCSGRWTACVGVELRAGARVTLARSTAWCLIRPWRCGKERCPARRAKIKSLTRLRGVRPLWRAPIWRMRIPLWRKRTWTPWRC